MWKKILRIMPAVLWMGLIFWLSDRPAWESTRQSRGIAFKSITLLPGAAGLSDARQLSLTLYIEPLIRDTAHIAEYAVLFLTVFFAVGIFSYENKKKALISLFICFLFACTDEWHQGYVPGRSVQLTDIVFDTAGAAAAMVILVLWKKASRRSS